MKIVFIYTELRCFSVCSVLTVLPCGSFYIGNGNKVLPVFSLIAPLYIFCCSLYLYVFAVNAVFTVNTVFSVSTVYSISTVFAINAVFTVKTVLSVSAVFTVKTVLSVSAVFAVNAVFTVKTVLSVSTVFAVNAVFSVSAVFAVSTVFTVKTVFTVSTSERVNSYKIVPFLFGGISPLDCCAVISHLRQHGFAIIRLAAYGSKCNAKYDAKHKTECGSNTIDSFFHLSLPPLKYCERYLSANRATPCFKTSIWVFK